MPLQSPQQLTIPIEVHKLPHVQDCRHCGAKKFPYETAKFCCSGGEVRLYPTAIPLDLNLSITVPVQEE